MLTHPFGREIAPLIVGLVTACLTIVGSTTSGAPMNMARTLGVAIVTDNWDSQWIYPLAGWLGALVATFVWVFILTATLYDWQFGSDLVLYPVYKLLRFLTFGLFENVFARFTSGPSSFSSSPSSFFLLFPLSVQINLFPYRDQLLPALQKALLDPIPDVRGVRE